jgi:Ca2+-binding EF-hand superfamily protein
MNIVNYGTFEEKCEHTFRFFDKENKGYITMDDFISVIFSLCEFFSTISSAQSNLNKC